VGTKFDASHAANNVTRKIKKHVSRKGVWRMCDQGPLGRAHHIIIIESLSKSEIEGNFHGDL